MRAALFTLALLISGCADSTDGTDPVVVSGTDVAVVSDTDVPADGSEVIADGDAVDGGDAAASVADADGDAVSGPASSSADGTSAGKTGDEDDGLAARAGDGRAATRTLTLSAEGEPYSQPVKLAAFPDFPVPFSTYIHDDMTVEQPGSGRSVSLEWSSGRVLVNWTPGDTVGAAVARIRAAVPDAETFPAHWAQAAFTYESGDTVGLMFVVVRDGGTVITIETSSSREGAEGAVTVEDAVLGEWQWADGSPLR